VVLAAGHRPVANTTEWLLVAARPLAHYYFTTYLSNLTGALRGELHPDGGRFYFYMQGLASTVSLESSGVVLLLLLSRRVASSLLF